MDIAHYRRSETLARQFMPSWRAAQAHSPHVFKAVGFPVQVESTADLVALCDTMQEGRHLAYQEELGGLTNNDFELLGRAFRDFARFASQTFHSSRVELPLATMTAHFSLHTKLCGWMDSVCSPAMNVLEIGPGCGYLSFFVSRRTIETYVQIETTESFYMLQHLVNGFCFPGGVDDHATVPDVEPYFRGAAERELQPAAWIPFDEKCTHLPWWRIGDAHDYKFDVVTSNANLTEFSDAAFIEYADLIRAVLKPDGMLLMQDFGGGPADVGQRFRHLHSAGFAPLVLVDAGTARLGSMEKRFATPNAVFVREGHPNFASLHQRGISLNTLTAADPAVRRMFRLDDIGPRRNYTGNEFAEWVNMALGD